MRVSGIFKHENFQEETFPPLKTIAFKTPYMHGSFLGIFLGMFILGVRHDSGRDKKVLLILERHRHMVHLFFNSHRHVKNNI